MNKKEALAREKAIQDYLGDCEIAILDNIEALQKKQEKLIEKLI